MADLSLIGEHVRVWEIREVAETRFTRVLEGVLVASSEAGLTVATLTDGEVPVAWPDVQVLMRLPACVCSS